MAKILPLERDRDTGFTHVFFCPGCGNGHGIDERWTLTGTPDKPTIRASVLVTGYLGTDDKGNSQYGTCHSFVTDGTIQYLPDSTHKLSGQTVDLPDIDE